MTAHPQGASGCAVTSNLGLPLDGGIVHQRCELGDQGAFEVFAVCVIRFRLCGQVVKKWCQRLFF